MKSKGNLSDAKNASMEMPSIVPLHFQPDTFVKKDTDSILAIGSVLMGKGGMMMAEADAWVMIPKLDKDKTGCVLEMRPLVLCNHPGDNRRFQPLPETG